MFYDSAMPDRLYTLESRNVNGTKSLNYLICELLSEIKRAIFDRLDNIHNKYFETMLLLTVHK